jgi:hypothetical protein
MARNRPAKHSANRSPASPKPPDPSSLSPRQASSTQASSTETQNPIQAQPRTTDRAGGRTKGRLVRNHSTNLQGLLPILERLCRQPGVSTLTPAVIGRARSHAPKFQLKISVPTQGGFKLIARQGKSFQEVFVTTHLDQAELEAAIQACLD